MVKFYETERLILRPLGPKDADGPYLDWLNDAEVCAGNSHHVFPFSRSQAVQHLTTASESATAIHLGIDLKTSGGHIGNISLQRLNWVYRSAEFAILLGDKTQWSKGYGLEAGQVLIRHGFEVLNLNRIDCATFESNEGMKKLAIALGMKEEGRRRQAAFKFGRFIDVIEFGITREDWVTWSK